MNTFCRNYEKIKIDNQIDVFLCEGGSKIFILDTDDLFLVGRAPQDDHFYFKFMNTFCRNLEKIQIDHHNNVFYGGKVDQNMFFLYTAENIVIGKATQINHFHF